MTRLDKVREADAYQLKTQLTLDGFLRRAKWDIEQRNEIDRSVRITQIAKDLMDVEIRPDILAGVLAEAMYRLLEFDGLKDPFEEWLGG